MKRCTVIFNDEIYEGTIIRETNEGSLVALNSIPLNLFHNRMWFLKEDIVEI